MVYAARSDLISSSDFSGGGLWKQMVGVVSAVLPPIPWPLRTAMCSTALFPLVEPKLENLKCLEFIFCLMLAAVVR